VVEFIYTRRELELQEVDEQYLFPFVKIIEQN